ncbi:hypothetical protein RJT34_04116 [Clitoria ternatea]|uniref:Transmembrane protein n=1 Tax=Clitoria ternatea TaxID=43366 RepID=A0AAN9KKN9_CLITE
MGHLRAAHARHARDAACTALPLKLFRVQLGKSSHRAPIIIFFGNLFHVGRHERATQPLLPLSRRRNHPSFCPHKMLTQGASLRNEFLFLCLVCVLVSLLHFRVVYASSCSVVFKIPGFRVISQIWILFLFSSIFSFNRRGAALHIFRILLYIRKAGSCGKFC